MHSLSIIPCYSNGSTKISTRTRHNNKLNLILCKRHEEVNSATLLKFQTIQKTFGLLIKHKHSRAKQFRNNPTAVRHVKDRQWFSKIYQLTTDSMLSLWPDSRSGNASSSAGFSARCALRIAALPMVNTQSALRNDHPETVKTDYSSCPPFLGPTEKHQTTPAVVQTDTQWISSEC